MEQNKKSEEVLAEIYRNAQLALTSIDDILPAVGDERAKNLIYRQHEEYERVSAKACLLARERGQELKEPTAIKKAMMWSGIKMNTLADNSCQHIAEMMLNGTVMGIAALRQSKTDLAGEFTDQPVSQLLDELIALEEGFEKDWKELL